MSYVVPAQVQYEERLIGPLTIKQSVYLAIGLVGAYFVYTSTLLPAPLAAFKIMIAGALALTGAGFAFFNLDVWLTNYIGFIQQPTTTSWISPEARKLMGVKSIRADSVFLVDSKALGVLKIKPINFGVLSHEDRDTVIYGFLEFLNALNFSVQIVMRSVNLDIEDYLRHLKRRIVQRDDKVALAYYEHFAEYMRSYIKVNKINDRHFYIIIPGQRKKNEKETLDYLGNQCNEIMSRLSLSGIVSERLNTKQIVNFYKSYYTDSFELYDNYISPITMYHKMWKEVPKPLKDLKDIGMNKPQTQEGA